MQEKLRKRANKSVDPIALESWINKTLNDAHLAKVDEVFKKTSQPKCQNENKASNLLFDFGLDR